MLNKHFWTCSQQICLTNKHSRLNLCVSLPLVENNRRHGLSSTVSGTPETCPKKFHQMSILDAQVFNLVDWEMVHKTLQGVPKLFKQWACKQVMEIAGTMEWDKAERKKCPSCMQARDTCVHVLFCNHAGRVETLEHTIDLMEKWLCKGDTDPNLLDCIAEYAYGRGGRTMVEICQGLGDHF
jgi:hypothetical protein